MHTYTIVYSYINGTHLNINFLTSESLCKVYLHFLIYASNL